MRLLKLLEAKCACDRTNHMATTELEDKHISIRRLRDRDAAEQALAPDAAPRRQDRSNFGISMRSNVISVDRCGAGEAQGVSPLPLGASREPTEGEKMRVGPGEPQVEHWKVVQLGELIERILGASSPGNQGPRVIAVDGRSGGGKSTLASQLHRNLAHSTVIHTDDVAWHHSYFGWSELLIEGVLRPVGAQQPVNYRPPAWESRGRQGAIVVEAGCEVLIIEGVGASRREVWPWVTASIWIQSDMDEAERRGIARDGGTEEARRFWMDWMREENEFLAQQEPWSRATAIVNGTPDLAYDAEHEVVVAV